MDVQTQIDRLLDAEGLLSASSQTLPNWDGKADIDNQYLDDLALFGRDLDLNAHLIGQQYLVTHTIGFDNDAQVLRDAADYSGGVYSRASSSASNTNSLSEALQRSITTLSSNTSGSGFSVSSPYFDEDGFNLFSSNYSTEKWSGDVKSITLKLELEGDEFTTSENWSAADNLPNPSARNLWTHCRGCTPNTRDFKWDQLSSAQRDLLQATDEAAEQDTVNFLRGSEDNEGTKGRGFRSRHRASDTTQSPLGDIIHSPPLFANNGDYGFPLTLEDANNNLSYADFLADKTQSGHVYVGSNDGILHAFDGDTGVETFGFIPATVFPNLYELRRPNYQHRYFIDGQAIVSDMIVNKKWSSVYVSSFGAGAKGFFALNVTDPNASPNDLFLWEVNQTSHPVDYKDLGYVLHQPRLVRIKGKNNDQWRMIVGNGVHSADGKAIIYVIDIDTGLPVQKLELDDGAGYNSLNDGNGITGITAVDENADSYADFLYASDLKGNIWRLDFDNIGESASNLFKSSFYKKNGKPKPLFTAKGPYDANGDEQISSDEKTDLKRQPITGGISVTRAPEGGYMLFFGTGRLYDIPHMFAADAARFEAIYGLWDKDENPSPISGLGKLVKQSFKVTDNGSRTVTAKPVNYLKKRGWYINLPLFGERVLAKPQPLYNSVLFVSQQPPAGHNPESDKRDPCAQGSGGWLIRVDQLTGAPALVLVADQDAVAAQASEEGAGAPSMPVIVQKNKTAHIITPPQNGQEASSISVDLQYKATSWRKIEAN